MIGLYTGTMIPLGTTGNVSYFNYNVVIKKSFMNVNFPICEICRLQYARMKKMKFKEKLRIPTMVLILIILQPTHHSVK